jgi:hypothetical protein
LGGQRLNEIARRAFRLAAKRPRCRFVLDSSSAYNAADLIRRRGVMPAVATKKKSKLFHANMIVTRIEEWCVEAETAERIKYPDTDGA